MTTSVTIINHGPLAIKVQAYDEHTGINSPEQPMIVESQRLIGPQTIFMGRSYKIEEDGPMHRGKAAWDRDIIEYGTVRGEQRTIHGSEHLDVEVDDKGRVVAVWFRCACLPFKQVQVGYQRAGDMKAQHEQVNKYGLMAVTMLRKT